MSLTFHLQEEESTFSTFRLFIQYSFFKVDGVIWALLVTILDIVLVMAIQATVCCLLQAFHINNDNY